MGQLVERDIVLGLLPPFHSFGLTDHVCCRSASACARSIHPNPTESAVLARLIEAYRATVIFGTPTFLGGIVRVAERPAARVAAPRGDRRREVPGRALRDAARAVAALIVLEGYGITECSPVVSVNPMDAPVPGSIGRLLPTRRGRRGRPRPDAARGARRDRHAAGARAEHLRRLPALRRRVAVCRVRGPDVVPHRRPGGDDAPTASSTSRAG